MGNVVVAARQGGGRPTGEGVAQRRCTRFPLGVRLGQAAVLHRLTGLLPMEDFTWLTPDRLVQRTTFGGVVEMIANFRSEAYPYRKVQIPPGSIAARHLDTGDVQILIPGGR